MDDALIRALKAAGVDVLTALEAGLIERPDYEHLAHATEQGRVLCTFNVGDFYRLHAERPRGGKRHAGIVLVPQQRYGPRRASTAPAEAPRDLVSRGDGEPRGVPQLLESCLTAAR